MANIAVVTDSNSGITQDEAKQMGICVLPMPFMIDGETYFEDITLTRADFYQKLEQDADIATSQPSPETVMLLWDRLLESCDQVIHIPMSSGLSGSCETACMLARDYECKVFVINNQRISVTQRQSVLDALALIKHGKSGEEIHAILEADKANTSIYITLNTLRYLKKGGRITPAAAALGTILKLKPVLQIQGDKLDAFAKARTMTQAKSMMINAIRNDINQRFGGLSKENTIDLFIAHTENLEEALLLKEELIKEFPDYGIYIDHLSLSVACHIGAGSLAFACSKRLDYQTEQHTKDRKKDGL